VFTGTPDQLVTAIAPFLYTAHPEIESTFPASVLVRHVLALGLPSALALALGRRAALAGGARRGGREREGDRILRTLEVVDDLVEEIADGGPDLLA
jgi:hypothetical protein